LEVIKIYEKIELRINIHLVFGFLLPLLLFFNAPTVLASSDTTVVAVDSPFQVKPGTSVPVYITVLHSGEISTSLSAAQSLTIESLPDIDSIRSRSTLDTATVEDIIVLRPLNLELKDGNVSYQLLPAEFEKLSPNEVIASAGDALIAQKMLETAYITEIKRIEQSNISKEEKAQKVNELLEEYSYKKEVLEQIAKNGTYHTVVLVKIPKDAKEGEIQIPVEITYTEKINGISTKQTVTKTLEVTVTNTIEPKRAIIIDVDALKRDTIYYSNGDFNPVVNDGSMSDFKKDILENGARFIDGKTVFPSITLAGHAGIFTGNWPKNHKIAGNAWFERSSKTYRKYSVGVWYEDIIWSEGQANEDLSKSIDTIYEKVSEANPDPGAFNYNNVIIYNHYWRDLTGGSSETLTIKPGLLEAAWTKECWGACPDAFYKVDTKAMSYALEILNLQYEIVPGDDETPPINIQGIPKILTIYMSGNDAYTHKHGPNGQIDYMRDVTGPQLNRLLVGDSEYDGINDISGEVTTLYNETIIVITADHGQTEVTTPIDESELESVLNSKGYFTEYDDPEGSRYYYTDAVVALNGGMAQIYVQNGLDLNNGDNLDGTWSSIPRWEDVQPAAQAFYEKKSSYIDMVLIRWDGSNGYKVYTGNGNTQDLTAYFSGKEDIYPDAVARINGLDSARSGDIILLSNYNNKYYFSGEAHKGEHGHLYKDDTYIPLIFSGPSIKKNVALDTPARNIDMARTLADLLGFSMPDADGVVLLVKEEVVPICPSANETCPLPDTTAPTIFNTRHDPASPSSSDSIHVYADIIDDTNVSSAVVWYTTDGTNWQSIPLTNVEGDTWRSITPIPAQPSGTEIQYTVCATDGSGNNACEQQAVCPLSQELAGIMERDGNASLEIDLGRSFRLSADAEYYASQEGCSIGVHTIIVGVVDTTPPPAPTLYDPGATLNEGEYYVAWSSVADEGSGLKHYELQESDSPSFNTVSYYTTATSYLITGKSSGTYYYRVRAIDNADNTGEWSNTQDVIVDIPPPSEPEPPAPSWSAIDSFDDESGTAYSNGMIWGDWRYEELLDDGTDNYVKKISGLDGRSGVGLFYWGTTLGDSAPQAIIKENNGGWDFSYGEGEWAIMMNNKGGFESKMEV
jgi:predicted AlkP superfamily pyrophosphatase or phosphodiesterase